MMAVDGKGDGQSKQTRPAKKGPEQDLPILKAFPSQNTQADARTKQGQETLEVQWGSNLGRPILSQKNLDPPVVLFG